MSDAGGAPNPYAPGATVADTGPASERSPPSRAWAIVASWLSCPLFGGVGLLLLGRPRRAAAWTAATLGTFVIMLAGGAAGSARLFLVGGAVWLLLGLAPFVDTVIARPGTRRPPVHPLGIIIVTTVANLGIALAARVGLLEAFQLPSGSLAPTLLIGDHIFVSKIARRGQPGDVIVFEFPLDPSVSYVFRVVGVAGDTIALRDGLVAVNGRPLPQRRLPQPCVPPVAGCNVWEEVNQTRRYLVQREAISHDMEPVTVGPGQVFVMGDNRDNANDSRLWGTVPVTNIQGKAVFVYWSSDPRGGPRWKRVGLPIR
jgi:signal peptidase I